MKSILIIIPYFGKFPKPFKFWLQSAYNNPTVNFLIFTDNQIESKENIKVRQMTFNDFRNKIQSKFDFEIALKTPYKICDFRGAYGYIFAEYTQNYDFWGFGDIDLIYGDIRHFLTGEVLSKHKVILGLGHLTLYKNTEECNHFFESKIEGFQYYKDVFSKPRNYLFDEFLHGGLSDMWKCKDPAHLWDKKPFDDVEIPLKSLNFKNVFNPESPQKLIFEYSAPSLYRIFLNSHNQIVKEPTLYAHFQMRSFMRVKTNNTQKYLIIPNAFINHTEVSISKLNKWCKLFEFFGFIWRFKYRVNKRLFYKKYIAKQNAFSSLASNVKNN
ncbi:MAG: DUF6625 family protein [Prolixibacteraceae bacterium]|jgi:hypothetical protein